MTFGRVSAAPCALPSPARSSSAFRPIGLRRWNDLLPGDDPACVCGTKQWLLSQAAERLPPAPARLCPVLRSPLPPAGAQPRLQVRAHRRAAGSRPCDMPAAFRCVVPENRSWLSQAGRERSLPPGPPRRGSRMPAKCVRAGGGQPGRRGGRSQGGTAAVWAPSLLARLEKLLIEFLSLPSLQLG